ncbi:MAG: hypothetical protein ACLQBB_02720 [Solirubrobacteraceae bacterium]
MRKALEIGGIVAAVVLIAFGIGAIAMGASGRSTVNSTLAEQKIVGTPDMTPTAIKAEATKSGLNVSKLNIPTCSVANQKVESGAKARCFAQYMTIHALEATGGLYYSQMPRYATANGEGTNLEAKALKNAKGVPVDNPAREVWIQETALSTALNSSYMASQVGLFGIVVGIALLLSGLGFAILAAGGALRNPDSVLRRRSEASTGSASAPVPSGV